MLTDLAMKLWVSVDFKLYLLLSMRIKIDEVS